MTIIGSTSTLPNTGNTSQASNLDMQVSELKNLIQSVIKKNSSDPKSKALLQKLLQELEQFKNAPNDKGAANRLGDTVNGASGDNGTSSSGSIGDVLNAIRKLLASFTMGNLLSNKLRIDQITQGLKLSISAAEAGAATLMKQAMGELVAGVAMFIAGLAMVGGGAASAAEGIAAKAEKAGVDAAEDAVKGAEGLSGKAEASLSRGPRDIEMGERDGTTGKFKQTKAADLKSEEQKKIAKEDIDKKSHAKLQGHQMLFNGLSSVAQGGGQSVKSGFDQAASTFKQTEGILQGQAQAVNAIQRQSETQSAAEQDGFKTASQMITNLMDVLKAMSNGIN